MLQQLIRIITRAAPDDLRKLKNVEQAFYLLFHPAFSSRKIQVKFLSLMSKRPQSRAVLLELMAKSAINSGPAILSEAFLRNPGISIQQGALSIARCVFEIGSFRIIDDLQIFLTAGNFSDVTHLNQFVNDMQDFARSYAKQILLPVAQFLNATGFHSADPEQSYPVQLFFQIDAAEDNTIKAANPEKLGKLSSGIQGSAGCQAQQVLAAHQLPLSQPASLPGSSHQSHQKQQKVVMLDEAENKALKRTLNLKKVLSFYKESMRVLQESSLIADRKIFEYFFRELLDKFLQVIAHDDFVHAFHRLFAQLLARYHERVAKYAECIFDFLHRMVKGQPIEGESARQFSQFLREAVMEQNSLAGLDGFFIQHLVRLNLFVLATCPSCHELVCNAIKFFCKLPDPALPVMGSVFAHFVHKINTYAQMDQYVQLLESVLPQLEDKALSQLLEGILNREAAVARTILKMLDRPGLPQNYVTSVDQTVYLLILQKSGDAEIAQHSANILKKLQPGIDHQKLQAFDLIRFIVAHPAPILDGFINLSLQLMAQIPQSQKILFDKVMSAAEIVTQNLKQEQEHLLFFVNYLQRHVHRLPPDYFRQVFNLLIFRFSRPDWPLLMEGALNCGVSVI